MKRKSEEDEEEEEEEEEERVWPRFSFPCTLIKSRPICDPGKGVRVALVIWKRDSLKNARVKYPPSGMEEGATT
jgi:hypothetical protein